MKTINPANFCGSCDERIEGASGSRTYSRTGTSQASVVVDLFDVGFWRKDVGFDSLQLYFGSIHGSDSWLGSRDFCSRFGQKSLNKPTC